MRDWVTKTAPQKKTTEIRQCTNEVNSAPPCIQYFAWLGRQQSDNSAPPHLACPLARKEGSGWNSPTSLAMTWLHQITCVEEKVPGWNLSEFETCLCPLQVISFSKSARLLQLLKAALSGIALPVTALSTLAQPVYRRKEPTNVFPIHTKFLSLMLKYYVQYLCLPLFRIQTLTTHKDSPNS